MKKTQKNILSILDKKPSLSIKDLAKELNLSIGTIKYHCKELGILDNFDKTVSKAISETVKIDEPEHIIEETQRESIINRPHNLAGSVKKITSERFNISSDKIEIRKSTVVPALIKLFMEVVDNSVDASIKGNCTKIDIKVNDKQIIVKDNGYGVSTLKDSSNEYILYKAFCKYNTSSNYREMRGVGKGLNGLGVKLCTTLSKKFTVISEDKSGKLKIVATENNLNHKTTKLVKSGKTGVEVRFEPDFNIFDCDYINQEHINRMYEYTLMQSLTYQNVRFTFNGKSVRLRPKNFLNLLSEYHVIDEQKEYFFAVVPSEKGEFRQLSYVNGLEVSKGGTHVNYIIDQVVRHLRDKLVKKYKTIKPADIKNKLQFIMIARNMRNIDWEGQVKSEITTPPSKMKEYFSNSDLEKFALKIYRNKEIMSGVIDYFKIKEEYNKKKDLKKLSKKVKIKSDKYLPPIKRNKYLVIAEGLSAVSAIIEPLGRTECGFYSLKGKPLNSYSSSTQKFTANKELSELFNIIKNEDYENIMIAVDSDVDGAHIAGLLIGFFFKYLPEYKNKVGLLSTPVIVIKNKNKIVRWFYSLRDDAKLKSGETSNYYKGLGSWKVKDLEHVIKEDGLDNMIKMLEFDDESEEKIDEWLGDNSEPRKKYILKNNFSIVKL